MPQPVGEYWVLHLVGALLSLMTVFITSLNVPANNRLASVPASDEVAASRGWADFTRAWRPANHLRSLTAITGAALLAWP